MTLHNLVKKRSYLFWSTKNYKGLSKEAVLEGVLNYGTMKDVQEVFSILGMNNAANIFYKQIKNKRNNYRPEIKNYFKLYFKKYTPR